MILPKKRFTDEEDKTLFELSHTMPIGTIKARLNDKPTDTYYKDVLSTNSISVYDNWKAISTNTTVCAIHCRRG